MDARIPSPGTSYVQRASPRCLSAIPDAEGYRYRLGCDAHSWPDGVERDRFERVVAQAVQHLLGDRLCSTEDRAPAGPSCRPYAWLGIVQSPPSSRNDVRSLNI